MMQSTVRLPFIPFLRRRSHEIIMELNWYRVGLTDIDSLPEGKDLHQTRVYQCR